MNFALLKGFHIHLLAVVIVFSLQVTFFDSSEANQQEIEKCTVPIELFNELLDWIERNTQYDVSTIRVSPPEIEISKSGELIEYDDKDVIVEKDTRALYDVRHKKIFLVAPWNADNNRDIGNLLHELIHAVQLENRNWDCLGHPEMKTYKLHEKWLLENGINADFNWFNIYILSRCPSDIHP